MNYNEVLKKRINTRKNALKNKGRQSANTCLKYNQTYNICDKKLCKLISILKKAYKNERENKFTKLA